MCDVQGESRLLSSGGPSGSKLRRPSCGAEEPRERPRPSRSSPGSPTASLRRAASLDKCFSDPEFFRKQRQRQQRRVNGSAGNRSSSREPEPSSEPEPPESPGECTRLGPAADHEVISNGAPRSCEAVERDSPKNGKDVMAPVLGVPPPPPPAPHMGPDGLILPRKPYNPCLTSNNHKDLHRELLFNQKIGKSVLNQKNELQRALERHREMVSRKEAERNQEESYRNDPRTALQRAIEQRAKHIELSQQPQITEPPNPLVAARAKLRSRVDSQ